jgi:hypothetical protein
MAASGITGNIHTSLKVQVNRMLKVGDRPAKNGVKKTNERP